MDHALSAALAIVGGVITLAIIAVAVSPNAQTPAVFNSAGGALSNVIKSAVSPVTNPGNVGGNFGMGSNSWMSGAVSGFANIGGLFG